MHTHATPAQHVSRHSSSRTGVSIPIRTLLRAIRAPSGPCDVPRAATMLDRRTSDGLSLSLKLPALVSAAGAGAATAADAIVGSAAAQRRSGRNAAEQRQKLVMCNGRTAADSGRHRQKGGRSAADSGRITAECGQIPADKRQTMVERGRIKVEMWQKRDDCGRIG